MPEVETLELLLGQVVTRQEHVRSATERVETKSVVLLGFAVTAAQLVLDRDVESGYLRWALGAFGVAVVAALYSVALRAFFDSPRPRAMADHLWQFSKEAALIELLGNAVVAFERNRDSHKKRVIGWWVALTFLTIGATLSIAHLARGVASSP